MKKVTKVVLPTYSRTELLTALLACIEAFKWTKPNANGNYLVWNFFHKTEYTETGEAIFHRMATIMARTIDHAAYGKHWREAVIRLNSLRPVIGNTRQELQNLSPGARRKLHKSQAPLSTWSSVRNDIFPKGYNSI